MGTSPNLQNEAKAVAVNVVATDPSGGGYFTGWAALQAEPLASVVQFQQLTPQLNTANAVILPMCAELGATPCSAGDLSVRAHDAGAHLVIDVVGYFRQMPPNWPPPA